MARWIVIAVPRLVANALWILARLRRNRRHAIPAYRGDDEYTPRNIA